MLQRVSFGYSWCSALEGFGAQVWGYFMICVRTDMARLRSSCNASHVHPKNRAVRSILAKCNSENIHEKNRLRINKDVKSHKLGVLGVSPKQSDGH